MVSWNTIPFDLVYCTNNMIPAYILWNSHVAVPSAAVIVVTLISEPIFCKSHLISCLCAVNLVLTNTDFS